MKKGFKPPHQAVQFTDFSTQQHRILEKEIEQDKERETKKEKKKKKKNVNKKNFWKNLLFFKKEEEEAKTEKNKKEFGEVRTIKSSLPHIFGIKTSRVF